jgi:hypothetical protein
MTATLVFVFVGAAVLCVVAGVVAVSRSRRASRDDDAGYPEATYAEEAAAVAAAQAAEAAAPHDEEGVDGEPLA